MLMLPLLACYAILMGILGGGIVGVAVFGIDPLQYSQQMRLMIGIEDFVGGIFKATVFGVIVAVAGCLRGMRCGQDAAAVGNAATSAVVTSIVGIVVADAAINVLLPCPRHPLSQSRLAVEGLSYGYDARVLQHDLDVRP